MHPDTVCDPDLRPSAITLNHLLQRRTTQDGQWTHLVRQPETYRCCVTDHREAADLYRAVWRYVDCGISVMERRLSPIARMSVEIHLAAHQLASSRQAERSLLHTLLDAINVDLRQLVQHNRMSEAAFTCFVLRPTGQATQTY